MLSREDLFVSNLFNYKDFYEGKRAYGWAGQHGYLKGVEMHTYPARALLSGADNPLRVTLKISKAEDFLLCRSFTAGYRVCLFYFARPNARPLKISGSFTQPDWHTPTFPTSFLGPHEQIRSHCCWTKTFGNPRKSPYHAGVQKTVLHGQRKEFEIFQMVLSTELLLGMFDWFFTGKMSMRPFFHAKYEFVTILLLMFCWFFQEKPTQEFVEIMTKPALTRHNVK
jgi:hypothetical protein